MIRSVTVQQRRAALVHRHHLTGAAEKPKDVVDALIALHATDPASVYLSVLARSRTTNLADVHEAMYGQRALVRWMAMRRTLFVFAREDIPMIQAAVSTPLAATLRRRLLSLIDRNGIEPPVTGDLSGWLRSTEARVELALRRHSATGAELRAAEPSLRGVIAARTRSEQPQGLTSPLLTLMSAEGRLVRGTPAGAWTTRHHRWEHVTAWWPDGLPHNDPTQAQTSLARRWLQRFGPATLDDLLWWTGWTKTVTRAALGRLDVEEVDLHGTPGINLQDAAPLPAAEPVASLLPGLDPTPMGWRHRDWFTAVDPAHIYDRAGNIGPTIWWNGEIIGSWAVAADGIRTHILADRGREAVAAVEHAAADLHPRLGGALVVPAARTACERHLSDT
ncbi:winged helix DNA-binding domain-containing protein [Actinoplanes sp. Pm04-4]|uniref:Winged helix DNA-binding domain-containing protein n=1 Tax=Paractinoplanes pyxinae TaxID=2997416 RepID=A0ABT4BCY8_9ACTN|nr:winged helix DNA-binding domain-containing protein [Actinoplanes pyxinae]MCY1143695.1 winged helix DNA-binding domain-containing protein [Actinoplanes pyxinae]